MNPKVSSPLSKASSGPGRNDAEISSAIRSQVESIIASPAFAGSKRSQEFLQLIVEHTLAGRLEHLRERVIGAEMFGRPIDYDTANDSIVRVKATEVRRKLSQYYSELDGSPIVRIDLPVGSYVPVFRFTVSPKLNDSSILGSSLSLKSPASDSDMSPLDHARGALTAARRYLLPVSTTIVGVLILLAVVSYIYYSRKRQTAVSEIHSIAVLPLQNLSDRSDEEYFSDGITDELISDLGQISSLRVISQTSAMAYRGTKKTTPEIARELNVDAVVEGSVRRENEDVRITVSLIDARNDQHIWGNEYVRNLTHVLSMQGNLAQSIADEIRIKVTPREQERLKRAYSLSPKAQDLYLVGLYILNSGDPRKAIDYLQRSVEVDPNYAPAQAALADAYGWLGTAGWLSYGQAFQKQKDSALKAIALDDSLSEGHAELAAALMSLNWDWRLPARELDRALELNPSSSPSHLAKAFYLAQIGQLSPAIYEVNRNLELDPMSSRSIRSAALIYYYARQYDEALDAMKKASVLDSTPSSISFPLGVIYTEKGMYKEAIEQFSRQAKSPHAIGHLGNALARSGDSRKAHATISSLEEYVKNEGIGRYEIAIVYVGLGDKERAFVWLENAYNAHDKGMTFLKIDPCLDPLRTDPRLQSLIVRTGLP